MESIKTKLLLSICFLLTVLLVVGCSASLELPQETPPQSNRSIQNMLEVKENSPALSGLDYSSEDRSLETTINDGHSAMNEAESIPTSSEYFSSQVTEFHEEEHFSNEEGKEESVLDEISQGSHEKNDLFTFNNRDDLPFANLQSYLTLMNEANDRMIAIAANFNSDQILWDYAFLDVTDQAKNYRNKIDIFVDMTEANGGDPCDGIIELWLIYPDGFVYGCYASPIYTPNNEYADYGGMGQIIISDGELNANFRYGFLPTGVSAFISSIIEAT